MGPFDDFEDAEALDMDRLTTEERLLHRVADGTQDNRGFLECVEVEQLLDRAGQCFVGLANEVSPALACQ